MIGPINASDRLTRVRRYFNKKRQVKLRKKFEYENRSQVAVRRLRIKGRFVTPEQAFQILGITQDELLSLDKI